MGRKRFTPERIITMPREADMFLRQGALSLGRPPRYVTAMPQKLRKPA
jgi:hypothetical protein